MEELRAVRRAHRERLLARARERARLFTRFGKEVTEEDVERIAYHYLSAPKMCSCVMCGNPRRTRKGKERLTPEERIDWTSEEV